MKVVLDTNVIIAAFATRGLCADILEVCLENHSIVISEQIVSEVEKNLSKKIRLPKKTAHSITDYLRDVTEIVEPESIDTSVCRDKDDVAVIGTALQGKAEVIITGDDDLLVLKKYRGIKIITPREFWIYLKTKN
ncbi:MAG: putative toxin-antitoxin system toxin component, PIN family [Candidatus Mariimomonas ferrooxydans]